MTPLSIDVNAAAVRVAQVFVSPDEPGAGGVWIEPRSDVDGGGVIIVAGSAGEFIALPDATGRTSRSAYIKTPGALTKLAVDLFRRNGQETRLKVAGGLAWIDPDAGGQQAAKNVELDDAFPNWRAAFAPHACIALKTPVVGDARMSRRIADVAANLANATGKDATWELNGGDKGAYVATFPCWPGAAAIFRTTDAREAARAHASSMWTPANWFSRPPAQLGLVAAQ